MNIYDNILTKLKSRIIQLDSLDEWLFVTVNTIQGRYGRDGFSYRNAPSYYYLSSLVARFSKTQLSGADYDKIREYYEHDIYLLYEA